MLRFASTKYASASRLKRALRSRYFDSEKMTSEAAKSNSSSAVTVALGGEGGRVYSKEGSTGEIFEKSGMRDRVYTYSLAFVPRLR